MTKTSPSPSNKKKVITLDFPKAIVEVIKGKKITRLEWENKKEYGFLNADILSLHKADEKNYQWIINDGDLLAKDWIVIS